MRRPLLLASWLLLAGPAACSGGAERVAPEAFARTVCASVASWQGELGTAAADLERSTAADPDGTRDALLAFLARATERTDRLNGEIDAAGAPSGDGGEALAREVRARADEAGRLVDAARADAVRLPEDDPGAVARGAEGIARRVREGGGGIGAPLGGSVDGPARQALRAEPACGGLAG